MKWKTRVTTKINKAEERINKIEYGIGSVESIQDKVKRNWRKAKISIKDKGNIRKWQKYIYLAWMRGEMWQKNSWRDDRISEN